RSFIRNQIFTRGKQKLRIDGLIIVEFVFIQQTVKPWLEAHRIALKPIILLEDIFKLLPHFVHVLAIEKLAAVLLEIESKPFIGRRTIIVMQIIVLILIRLIR